MDDALKKDILATLKTEGLDVAEDMAVVSVKAAFALIKLIVPKFSTGLGVVIGPMVDLIEPQVLKLIDTIDGVDDPDY